MGSPASVKAHPFVERAIELEKRPDGALLLRSRTPLRPFADTWPTLLTRQARHHPQRTWLAQRRGTAGEWVHLSYGQAKAQADAVTQALLDLGKPGRCVLVLSENSIEHAVMELAAMQAGMPYVPISPAYSLLTQDFAKLQSMIGLLEPALVFAQDGQRFARALAALQLPGDALMLCVHEASDSARVRRWHDWTRTPATLNVMASISAITPETVAKYLFTSGSTGLPKAATITHGMLCNTVGMHQQVEHGDQLPPMEMLDWMPWSHVASGNVIFGRVLASGGTIWIDEGKPLPGRFEPTVRNLREVSPTEYSGVPLGYTMLVTALEEDPSLAQRFFARLQKISYAGAKMPESLVDRLQAVSIRTIGQRIPFISGFGSTETAASVTMSHWNAAAPGCIGLPHPGVELKLLPLGDERYEVRVRSVATTPGYLKNPEATAAAFDDEGFFLMGDAVQFVDPARPEEGLRFAGRVAEEFKLLSGIFVRVGSLRVEAIEAAGGLLADVVVAGADEADIALLAWPNFAACRRQEQLAQATDADILVSGWLRDTLREAFRCHNAACGGSSRRIARLLLLSTPPDLGSGELTDKGYVNQKLVLQRRSDDVRRLYAAVPEPAVIVVD